MNRIGGLHHLAVCTADMKTQIEFFTDKLGMELVALYWMHGVPNTWHGFLRLGDESAIAFVHNPSIAALEAKAGETYAGNPGGASAPGTMQHLALRVADHDELLALRDRLRSKGVPVLGPVDHGMCVSCYFAGPENLSLELSYSNEPIDQEAWIDPEVVALAGIDAEELARYKRPAAFEDSGGAVPQPPLDAPGPHMSNYPEGVYEAVITAPDAAILNSVENRPPVRASAED
ncbi:MAG: VOC family protein [Pseudomonadales bacterium]|jgi:catechol 2,3-dioxygenase-like lactoylglutathione lyase family enzyme|nr:VOC family protein [Pseudomonadales bacterium]